MGRLMVLNSGKGVMLEKFGFNGFHNMEFFSILLPDSKMTQEIKCGYLGIVAK